MNMETEQFRLECLREAVKLALNSNEIKPAKEILQDARKFAKFVLQ